MSLPFCTTSMTREIDGGDGYLYRTVTALDFHQGWITRLTRTKRSSNGYPMWSHGSLTQSLIENETWSPQCAARPIRKFESFEQAEAWLEVFFTKQEEREAS